MCGIDEAPSDRSDRAVWGGFAGQAGDFLPQHAHGGRRAQYKPQGFTSETFDRISNRFLKSAAKAASQARCYAPFAKSAAILTLLPSFPELGLRITAMRGVEMSDSVFKKIEIVGTSSKSFDDATSNAVAKASETMSGLSWFEVVELRGAIAEGKVKQYQVTVRIGCKVD